MGEPAFKPVIDVHAHILPSYYTSAMVAAGFTDDAGRPVGDGFPFPTWRLDDSGRVMDRHSIVASAISISAPGVNFLPARKASDLARALNEEMAAIVANRPHRFAGLAVLPLADVDAALAEIEYALDDARLDGIGLLSNVDGRYLGDAFFRPLLEELDRRGATVFVHPNMPPGFDAYGLGIPAPILEYPFDTARVLTNLIYSGDLERYGNIKFIVPHAGGAMPYLAGRIAGAAARFAHGGSRIEREQVFEALRRVHYDLTAVNSSVNLALLRTLVPATNLLIGYDYPFRAEATIAEGAAILEQASCLSDAEKDDVRFGNALRLFPRLSAYVDR